jgi:hypothetical protein
MDFMRWGLVFFPLAAGGGPGAGPLPAGKQ